MIDEQKWETAYLNAMVRLQVREIVLTEEQNGETNVPSAGGGYMDVAGGAVQDQPSIPAQPQ